MNLSAFDFPSPLLIPIGIRPYPMRGHHGKKDLESPNMKAPGAFYFPLGPFILPFLDCLSFKNHPNL
jgi:hypothetical protein